MTDSIKLDSRGLNDVAGIVYAASTSARTLSPAGLDEKCITSDFRSVAEDLASLWRDESRATAEYLREYMGVLHGIAEVMGRAEAELARQAAGDP